MVKLDGKSTGDSLIQVRNLEKKYHRGTEVIDVLNGLNLDIGKGEFVAFMGPSGSGKTTLLNLLGGLDLPTSGDITVSGDDITLRNKRGLFRRMNDDFSTGKTFPRIIVGITLEYKCYPPG